MRNLKKFLALVLAMMMTLSLMVTANAATSSKDLNLSDSEKVSDVFLEDIQVLTGMEVIKGYPDGSFKPDVTINRHQMATFIYRMTTGDTGDLKDVYLSEIAAEKFPDVKAEDSYAGYIGYCWVNGYIAGFPDGNGGYVFKPMNKVTGYQALVMILRAMGYNNPNDNFTGKDWQSLALSRARMNNLLVNIDKTVYNGTFSQPAPRELVAEMVFQGLIQPQVVYTSAMGYQKYGMEGGVLSSILNPTLGETNFGLTHHRGIIVGNTATGEADITERVSGETVSYPTTKIGFALDSEAVKELNDLSSSGNAVTGTTPIVGLTQTDLNAVINNDVSSHAKSYVYASGTTGASTTVKRNGADVDAITVPENVTLAFRWESNLKQFGHAVDVWYDSRSSATETVGQRETGQVSFPTNLNTYAVFDRVNKEATRVVTAPNAALTNNNDTTPNESLGEVLGVVNNSTAYWNYAFGPTKAASTSADGAAVTVGYGDDTTTVDFNAEHAGATNDQTVSADFTSPVMMNNAAANTDTHQLYLVVSNNAAGTPDLIVSLNVTVSVVSQDNNTTAPLSTGIVTQNGVTAATTASNTPNTYTYFDRFDYIQPALATGIVGNGYSNIANANLLDSDDVALRDYVAAVTITGTARTQNYGGTDGSTQTIEENNGNATKVDTIGTAAGATDNSSYYYELKKVDTVVSGRVSEINRTTQDVYLEGRTEPLHRSVFALAVDGSFKDRAHVTVPERYTDVTFYVDEDGNWLFWEEGSTAYQFVYGTYMDYESAVASGTFAYPFVYVNEKGEDQQITRDITRMTMGDGAIEGINNEEYNDSTSGVILPKRTNLGGNSAGFVQGKYVGYSMNGGTLTAVTDTNAQNTGFVQAGSGANPLTKSVVTSDFEANNTLINRTDAAVGAVPVGNWTTGGAAVTTPQDNLFLTNETKFVVVTGAGTATQDATVYTGLSELIGAGNSSVELKTAGTFTGTGLNRYLTDASLTTNPYEMVYYSVKPFEYSQTYDPSAYAVDTVFIPAALIDRTADPVSGDLFFLGDDTPGLINTTGTYATQYTFYQDGTAHKLWIMGTPTYDWSAADEAAGLGTATGSSDAKIISTLSADGGTTQLGVDNVFYRLRDSGAKAHDGQPIYRIVPVAVATADGKSAVQNADGMIIGRFYDGTGNVNGTTLMGYPTTSNPTNNNLTNKYLATTYSDQVAYIGTDANNARVLWNVGNAGVKNLDADYTINSLAELNNASSLASNNGIDVSCVLNTTALQTVSFIYVNF